MTSQREKYHVLAAGVLSLVLTMGVARFAYTPLIPIMQGQSVLTDLTAGLLATLNYVGYLCGALLAASISDLLVKDKLYRAGLIIAVLTTLGMALAENVWLWALMRFIAGFSSAAGLLIGSGLILNWLIRNHFRSELGIHFMGIGLGIALSALAVDLMIDHLDWRWQWIVFALLGLILAIPAWRWLPRPLAGNHTLSGKLLVDTPPTRRFSWLMQSAYFCAGFGYVISATFIVAIVERQPGLEGQGELVWLLIGASAVPAVLIWDQIARRIGMIPALLISYILQIAGVLLPVANNSLYAALISAVLYGGTFVGIVSLVLTMAGRFYPTRPAQLMARFTLAYCVAQIAGPFLTGWMAETSGHYSGGLLLAALMMMIGTLLLTVLYVTEKQAVTVLE